METYDINVTNNIDWPDSTGDWWNPPFKITPNTTPTYSYWSSVYPTTIYMYQLQCPECKAMNWGQLDTTVECKNKKCKATLRAVTTKPDHVIEVAQ